MGREFEVGDQVFVRVDTGGVAHHTCAEVYGVFPYLSGWIYNCVTNDGQYATFFPRDMRLRGGPHR